VNATSERTKIFCIGLSKTGTTSLAAALERLGYKVRDNIGVTRFVPGDLSCIDERELAAYDAFTDMPIPSFYRRLDEGYPNSRFILTMRNRAAWLQSCKKQFTTRNAASRNEAVNALFLDMYGSASYDEDRFSAGYTRFVDGVLDYFKERQGDLLVFAPCDGDGWDKLCRFLNKPVPDTPFPVTNVTTIEWMQVEDVVAIARKAGRNIPNPDSLLLPEKDSANGKGIARYLGNKLRRALVTKRRARFPKELEVAYQTIVRELHALNPSIPVLSEKTKHVSYSERKNWSHVWLVDTFAGQDALLNGSEAYAINIALIQNGSVRLGVVFFPGRNIAYYTKDGRVTYKQTGTSEVEAIPPRIQNANAPPIVSPAGRRTAIYIEAKQKVTNNTKTSEKGNVAHSSCAVAEGTAKEILSEIEAVEWEIAAGHAVLKGSNHNVVDLESKQELSYNKEQLSIRRCLIQ
jgi:3'-phosphoadenosine 5'-phosphosulfate (PAPS) 3'-phosphatase